jgi:hypothetical protein
MLLVICQQFNQNVKIFEDTAYRFGKRQLLSNEVFELALVPTVLILRSRGSTDDYAFI